MLDDHLHACVPVDVKAGRTDSFEKLREALNQYMR